MECVCSATENRFYGILIFKHVSNVGLAIQPPTLQWNYALNSAFSVTGLAFPRVAMAVWRGPKSTE